MKKIVTIAFFTLTSINSAFATSLSDGLWLAECQSHIATYGDDAELADKVGVFKNKRHFLSVKGKKVQIGNYFYTGNCDNQYSMSLSINSGFSHDGDLITFLIDSDLEMVLVDNGMVDIYHGVTSASKRAEMLAAFLQKQSGFSGIEQLLAQNDKYNLKPGKYLGTFDGPKRQTAKIQLLTETTIAISGISYSKQQ